MIGFENVCGEDIDKVTGKRVTLAPSWRWEKGDGCIVRMVAMLDPTGGFRIPTGKE
jgi:kynurenine formamidase